MQTKPIAFVLLFLLLFFLLIAQATLFTLPLLLDMLLVLYIRKKALWVLSIACICGFLLDMLTVRIVGLSSFVFVLVLLLVAFYERKFEVATTLFVFAAAFLGSLLYLLVFGHSHIVEQALVSALFAITLFKIL